MYDEKGFIKYILNEASRSSYKSGLNSIEKNMLRALMMNLDDLEGK